MFSISRSRYTLLSQSIFLGLNAAGVLLAIIYDSKTPDLYPNNMHHKIGWLLTGIVTVQTALGVISRRASSSGRKSGQTAFIPVSTANMAEHQRVESLRIAKLYRFSNDSGQGTEPKTESLRSQSITSTGDDENQLPESRQDHEMADQEENFDLLRGSPVDSSLIKRIPRILSFRALRVFQFTYNAIDRLILILGFVAIVSGIVAYGGFFVSSELKFL